jgi:hypothetical protein
MYSNTQHWIYYLWHNKKFSEKIFSPAENYLKVLFQKSTKSPGNGHTCDLPSNPFTGKGVLKFEPEGKRIDYILYRCNKGKVYMKLGLRLWCLTPLSTTFQLYHGGQFLLYWLRTPEYPEKTKVTDKLYVWIKWVMLGLWCLTPLSTTFQLYYGGQFFCIGWRHWSTRRKPKWLTNFTCELSG